MSNAPAEGGRAVLLVTHPRRPDARALATRVVDELRSAGIEVRMVAEESDAIGHDDVVVIDIATTTPPPRAPLVIARVEADGMREQAESAPDIMGS